MIEIEDIHNNEFKFLLKLGSSKKDRYELTELATKELYEKLGEKLKMSAQPEATQERSRILQLDEVRELIRLCEEIDNRMSKEEWSDLFQDAKDTILRVIEKAKFIKAYFS